MRLGWSEKEFNLAFKLQPMFMLCSEKQLRELIEFLVNNQSRQRIILRCSVLQILMLKGLTSKNVDIVWVLNVTKKWLDMNFIDPLSVVLLT